MHIVLIHNAVVPPRKYGGTERVLDWLGKALVKLGQRVSLIAQPGSFIPGVELIPLSAQDGDSWKNQIPSSADLLHLWATPREPLPYPFVVTIEGNGKEQELFHPNTIFVSAKHAVNHGSTHFVYNGIDPDDYEWLPEKENFAVFLAKASWKVKNLAGAIEIARNAQIPLHVLGSRDWPFNLQKKLPAWRGVKYHGMVDDQEKRKILKMAKVLLFPVLWEEPFGIAITEALASGCGVLGTPYGSLPEIITPEVGYLGTKADDLISALKTRQWNPEACRQRVYQGFTHLQMASKYLGYYQNIMSCGHLEAHQNKKQEPPQTKKGIQSDSLAPWIRSDASPQK